jgi:acetyl-CoA C-acetyltransferase
MLGDWGDVPGVTINRFCASGIDAVAQVGSVFMGISADLVATIEGNKRNELDAYGLETQAKAARAWDEGFRRDLDAGPDRMNPNGGTIAMGHAFGATGAAGLGVAVLVERVAS